VPRRTLLCSQPLQIFGPNGKDEASNYAGYTEATTRRIRDECPTDPADKDDQLHRAVEHSD
jgi:hypothetical protein